MSQVCRQCSRINPADAAYCYFDGAILAGTAGGGPINAGSAPFPNQFVFPTGQICKNFDQLALACQQNWKNAIDMLKQGFLGTFFGGLGRADLAMAAMEANKFPDVDRGLDQLLSKLPTHVLQDPKLKAEPTEVNLGQLAMGTDRNSEIHLSNQGMRLLYGSIDSDCKWLTLGDAQAGAQKLFQFSSDTAIPVHIRGQHLRAGTKPLEGHLVVESNGGTATITFRADVPIKPFKGGLFDGCKTPRQIAEKAKASPKDAGPYFESGAVAQWFSSNGWTYPVQGPSAAGLGGVQQFFEALGLAKAPKVEISLQSLSFRGDGGQSLQATIEVTSPEKKPVYAYATCEQPWVDCSRVKLAGRTATITVAIPRVPNRPGETLQTNIRVMGNGNQKFTVPLNLTIDRADPSPQPAPGAGVPEMTLPQAGAVQTIEMPFAEMMTAMAPAPITLASTAVSVGPVLLHPASSGSIVLDPPRTTLPGRRRPLWFHLAPLLVLVVALTVVLCGDAFGWWGKSGGSGLSFGGEAIDKTTRLGIFYDYADKPEKDISNTMNFGLVMVDPANPKVVNKKLTYDHRGRTNSTVMLIDSAECMFGSQQIGKWDEKPQPLGNYSRDGKSATFLCTKEQVTVTQRVEIIPGEAVETAPDTYKRLLDTCLVRYTIKNRDTKAQKVGLRMLLDTLIGANDGCPFTVPIAGAPKLVATFEDFHPNDPRNKKPIPDFVQALEFENLQKPGTIAQVNFKLGGKIEAPSRVMLTRWPGWNDPLYQRKYDVPLANIENDSAVVMYWHPVDMTPGGTRELGFSYGIGNLSAQNDKIALTFGGSFVIRGELSVVALIADPEQGQKATLELPSGAFTILESPATQPVPPSTEKTADGRPRPSPVTWRIRSERDGTFPITVRTSNNLEATRKITIKKSSIF